jgi:FkbM family methyltransferase
MLKMVMPINSEFVREVGAFHWLQRTFFRQFSKRILRKDNTIVLPTGLRMRLPRTSKFATEVFITRANVDWGSEELFADHLDASGAVLDIGANIGYYSLYVLPRISAVHAFEPDPRALLVLRANLTGHSNAHVHNLAVGNCPGKSLFALEQNSEVSHLVGPSTETGKELHEIEVTTIDDFVADRKLQVTGIKIDVEGADLDVIEGGLKTLGSQFPLVLTETKPDDRLFHLIRPLEYRVFAFVKHPDMAPFMFREIAGEGNFQTKMLFLVPMRLQPAFEALSAGGRSKTV